MRSGWGSGTSNGGGYYNGNGYGDGYGVGGGEPDGTGYAYLYMDEVEFTGLKRVPRLITEIRRANAQG